MVATAAVAGVVSAAAAATGVSFVEATEPLVAAGCAVAVSFVGAAAVAEGISFGTAFVATTVTGASAEDATAVWVSLVGFV